MLVIFKIEIGGNKFKEMSFLKEFNSKELSRIEMDHPEDKIICEDVGWNCML